MGKTLRYRQNAFKIFCVLRDRQEFCQGDEWILPYHTNTRDLFELWIIIILITKYQTR